MSILNTSLCASNGANTGVSDCPVDVKLLQFLIAVPSNFELTDTQMASAESVMTALKAALINDNPALRIYPFPQQVTFTDNSTEAAFQTFGSGSLIPANDGMYNWMFQFIRGGLCLSNKLRRFNGSSGQKFLAVDAQGMLYGTKVGTSLKGIPANYIYTDKLKAATYTEVAVYAYRVDFMPTYFNENIAFVKLNLVDLLGLNGLQDIIISSAAPRVTNVIKVKLTTGCSGFDLYDLYPTELAAVGNFKVTEGGKDITITSVAADPNAKAFTITMDATDPDYSAAGPFTVSLAPVSALTSAGVVGYEGKSLTVA